MSQSQQSGVAAKRRSAVFWRNQAVFWRNHAVVWRKPWTMNHEPITIKQCRRSAVVWRKPRTMNTVPRTNHPSCLSRRVPPRHLYICRESSTNHLLFMQNKPNFQDTQMNVNTYNTMEYENSSDWTIGQNKPNSNPIKPNFRKAKMNVNLTLTKDYRKKDDFTVRINKPNFVKGSKWTQTYML